MVMMDKSTLPWGPARRRQIDAPKTLADEAYKRIHDDIIRGAFAPNEKLQPDVLRERYGIGLSPVREALSRVALEGLAVTEGQRGFFVAPATRQELLDIADLRIQFSALALERSIRRGDDSWENRVMTTYYQLHKLENQVKKEPRSFHHDWERRNRDFHQALESGCGSPWLLHFCDILYDQLERYRRLYVVYTDIDPMIAVEHRQIMELALARDTAACKVLKQHFEHAASVIGAGMAEALNASPPVKKGRAAKAAKATKASNTPSGKPGKAKSAVRRTRTRVA